MFLQEKFGAGFARLEFRSWIIFHLLTDALD
jgi:hypothetical protein